MATRRMTQEEEKRLVQELWEHRDDPDEWEEEPTEFAVSPNPGVVYSIRFTAREFRQISEMAERKGIPISELIKAALLKSGKPGGSGAKHRTRSART